MSKPRRLVLLATALVLGAGALGAWVAQRGGDDLPALPERPAGVLGLVRAQPFVLDEPYTHTWRAEQPLVRAGYLLVLDVDPQLAYPRQTETSVLYVGAQTAERVNHGHLSGRLVVLVPSEVDAEGLPLLDLARTPIWFGAPALPEQVGEAEVRAELARALAAGLPPPSTAEVERALATGGGLFAARDRVALERHAARLILELVPQERELAEGLLVPLLGR
jgi:hypothetical protein